MNNRKVKVIFTIHGLGVGGAEKFLVSLVNSLDKEKFDCSLISYSDSNPLIGELNESIDFHPFGRKNKFDISPLKKTRRLVKAKNPDISFSVGLFSFSLFHLATRFLKSPNKRIISYHTTIHRSSKDHKLMKLYLKFLRKNDEVIGVCKNQIEYTSNTYHIPMKKLDYIYNGVDTKHWRMAVDSAEKLQIRNKLAIPHDAKVIIMTAAFRIEKNHKGAIEAFKKLQKKSEKDLYLLLVGDGPEKNSIMQIVNENGLNEKVIFAGKIQDVRPYYWSADLFALTSTGVETFSIAALEALSCGLPGVLTNIGGANEMIEDGVNGYLTSTDSEDIYVNWKKCIEHDFSNSKIAVETAEKFDLTTMIKKYEIKLSDI